jgi:hypothetical protein
MCHTARRLLLGLVVLSVAGCSGRGGGKPAQEPPAEAVPGGRRAGKTARAVDVVSLTEPPLRLDEFTEIVPLGNLNPPGHTFPSDHVYFYLVNPRKPHAVFAPAAGEVDRIFESGRKDDKVVIRVTPTWRYYLGHVTLDPAVRPGQRVRAGEEIGTFSGRAFALDLGVINETVTRAGFINPNRYPPDTIHADAPLKYFAEPLRTTLYARVRRSGPDKDGKIDYDVPGRLAGNWFLEGLDERDSATPHAWGRHLAFVRDVHDPAAVRIAVGGTLAVQGVFAVQHGATDPAVVTPQTGKVTYRLLDARDLRRQRGLMIVRMVNGRRIRVQAFADAKRQEADFGGAAVFYVR